MVIDESDIMRMDLARHRARITIIPQGGNSIEELLLQS